MLQESRVLHASGKSSCNHVADMFTRQDNMNWMDCIWGNSSHIAIDTKLLIIHVRCELDSRPNVESRKHILSCSFQIDLVETSSHYEETVEYDGKSSVNTHMTEFIESEPVAKMDNRFFGELLAEVYRKNIDIHTCISEHVSKIRGRCRLLLYLQCSMTIQYIIQYTAVGKIKRGFPIFFIF